MSIAETFARPFAERTAEALAPSRDRLSELEVPLGQQVDAELASLEQKRSMAPFAFAAGLGAALFVCGAAYADARRSRAAKSSG